MKIRLTIEVEIESAIPMDADEKAWFKEAILTLDGLLSLHSNELGDTVGEVTRGSNVHYLKTDTDGI